jgi:hypothetical protein
MRNEPKEFADKNGELIKAGDIIRLDYFLWYRERPGHQRVAINGFSQESVIVSDEGGYSGRKEPHWVTYEVGWNGACLVAERRKSSGGNSCMGDTFDENGNSISVGSGQYNFYENFNSRDYVLVRAL